MSGFSLTAFLRESEMIKNVGPISGCRSCRSLDAEVGVVREPVSKCIRLVVSTGERLVWSSQTSTARAADDRCQGYYEQG